jgi:hypothetical protein
LTELKEGEIGNENYPAILQIPTLDNCFSWGSTIAWLDAIAPMA